MASKMMLGLLTVICMIDLVLLFKQTSSLADKDLEIKALVEINQNTIEATASSQSRLHEDDKIHQDNVLELQQQIHSLTLRLSALEEKLKEQHAAF